jgi:hypothetical protein
MPALFLALLSFAAIALLIAWLLRANPLSLARVVRVVIMALGGIGVGAMLIFGLRLLPGLLPGLMGLAGIAIIALIARAFRNRTSGGFSAPGTGRRTEVNTTFLQAWIDHSTGDVGGTVLAGRFAGRILDMLTGSELLDLRAECATDADSLRVLEAYLDRRLGSDWRSTEAAPPRSSRSDMSREEALAVLGLPGSATAEEIKAAHRRLIQRMHPDVGGSAELAARINRAKDVLLGG